jgi:hypothetical protein
MKSDTASFGGIDYQHVDMIQHYVCLDDLYMLKITKLPQNFPYVFP